LVQIQPPLPISQHVEADKFSLYGLFFDFFCPLESIAVWRVSLPFLVKNLLRIPCLSGQDLIDERDGSGAVLSHHIYAGGIDNPVAVLQGTNTYF
jgi:hypothetical protein